MLGFGFLHHPFLRISSAETKRTNYFNPISGASIHSGETMTDYEDHEGNGMAADALYAEDNGGRGDEIEDQLDSKFKVLIFLFIFSLPASDFWMFVSWRFKFLCFLAIRFNWESNFWYR